MAIPSEEETLRELSAERKISCRINSMKNPNYKTERVYVNGVCYQIEVDKTVEVPETVYNLLVKKGII